MNIYQKIFQMWSNYGLVRTIAACFAAHTASLIVGLSQGFSAILLPQLTDDHDMDINTESASWIASLGVISNPPGALLAGFLSECYGRKRTVQLSSIPFLIGWVTIAQSMNFQTLCVGRFITGLAVGMITTTFTYIAEITPARQRGLLSAFGPVVTSFGVLLVYILGYFLHWKTVALVCVATSTTTLVIMHLVPESPPWLVSKERFSEALKALTWLRASASVAENDLAKLLVNCKRKNTNKISNQQMVNLKATLDHTSEKHTCSAETPRSVESKACRCCQKSFALHENHHPGMRDRRGSRCNSCETIEPSDLDPEMRISIKTISERVDGQEEDDMKKPPVTAETIHNLEQIATCKTSLRSILISPKTYKPFTILLLFFLFQELSGIYIILFYSVNFLNAVGTNLNDYISTIIVGTLRFIASIIGAILIQKHPRKTLATTSGIGMSVFLLGCGAYLKYYEVFDDDVRLMPWLPLVCILSSVVFSMFGFLQLPYVMNSELFPLQIRGIMSGVVLSIANCFIFVSVKIYPNLLVNLNLSGVLFLFGSASFLGALYCSLFLPETKNKSLAEIEASFEHRLKLTKKSDVESVVNDGKE